MEQSTLAEILAVERDIRTRLDAERERANRWLENARHEIEQEHSTQLAQIRSAAAARRDAALRAAHDRASAELLSAEAAAGTVGLSDDALRPIVRRHLTFLLPEAAR